MGYKYKILNGKYPHFLTCTVIDWVDLFSRSKYSDIVIQSLSYCQAHKGLRLHAWCIMSNHIHLIVSSDNHDLWKIIRDFKAYTSNSVKSSLKEDQSESRKEWLIKMFKRGSTWKLWKHGYHGIELSWNIIIDQKLDYLHNNPVKAGYVDLPEHWQYSSARDYAGLKGLLEIDML